MTAGGHLRPPDHGGTQTDPRGKSYSSVAAGPSSALAGASTPGSRSFVAVTQGQNECKFPAIKLATRQYGVKDGKPVIHFTAVGLQVGYEHLKHALVAKFSGGRPPIQEVRRSFIAVWCPSARCSIGAWDAKHILIILELEQDANKVLSHPLRKLGHSPFRIFRWNKDFNSKTEPTTTTAWIRLPFLPPGLYNPGFIAAIVSAFGNFLAVDNRTRNFSNPNYARVCMEIDSTKEMPDEVWISTGASTGFLAKNPIRKQDGILH
ncbi:hypothetical protein QQ045_003089 [Rhodiola kirilowii]